jgi:hypothetical protein
MQRTTGSEKYLRKKNTIGIMIYIKLFDGRVGISCSIVMPIRARGTTDIVSTFCK